MADEEIDEIRKIRHDISMRFEHDISRLVAHYQELEKGLKRSGEYRFADSKPGQRVRLKHDPGNRRRR